MKKKRVLIDSRRRSLALGALAAIVVLALLLFRIESLIPNLLPRELETTRASAGVFMNPLQVLHFPLLAMQRVATLVPSSHKLFLKRLPSTVLGVIAFGTFAYITRRWYGRRSMILGCILFVTSAWFLHAGRFAGVDIEYMAGILGLLAIHIGIYDHGESKFMIFGWLLVNILLLFIPGFIWFILLSLIWQRFALINAFQKISPIWLRIVWIFIALTAVGVLVYMFARTPVLIWEWMGLPHHFVSIQTYLRQIGEVFTAIVFRAQRDPQVWLGMLPMLDIFTAAMFFAGLFFYVLHWRATRTHLLLGYFILGGVLAGLHAGAYISIMAPLVFLIATGGIAYSIYLWLRRFPINNIARSAGILLIVLMVGISSYYNLKQYFIAWPNSPETRSLIIKQ